MGDYNSIDKTPFNSSLAFLERIEKRWEDADLAKIRGDTLSYFRCLEVIFRNTHPFFMEEETEKIEEDVKQIERLLESNYGSGTAARQAAGAGIFVGENKCDLLRMKLVKLLFKYKITYYKLKTVGWEDEIKEDFE